MMRQDIDLKVGLRKKRSNPTDRNLALFAEERVRFVDKVMHHLLLGFLLGLAIINQSHLNSPMIFYCVTRPSKTSPTGLLSPLSVSSTTLAPMTLSKRQKQKSTAGLFRIHLTTITVLSITPLSKSAT
ncbi:hypothetical protein JCM19239_5824 [Vibrio variabilis]|uniref:Uncharacterized protein n=1 Tax=Vibrio variabilis TaxID=990271 RepID=A0ABQ0J8E8_9VIBR|nr:hypothetical protein JCM19239_5824 [Vibrio variabilis]